MKKLSDFKDERGIEIAADVLAVCMEMLTDPRNMAQKEEKSPFKMFSAFMRNTPAKMMQIFAILSEQNPESYHCDGAEAMTNILIMANDPIIMSLFLSQSQTGDAKSSGSAMASTEEQKQ